MDCRCLIVGLLSVLCVSVTNGISTAYLNTACNVSSVSLATSYRLESSTRLHYSANTNCFFHVVADTGKLVLLIVRLFNLENLVSGSCVDYVNVHDGADTNAATLNSSPLCGQSTSANYTSTGNEMTVYFHSDATGQSLGFDFTLVAITTGTCSSSQFTCANTSICIDGSLTCNTLDECGDSWDEYNCVYSTQSDIDTDNNTGLIAGSIVGGFVFIVVCLVAGNQLWKYYRWRLLQAKPIDAKRIEHEPTTYTTTYPVTRVYYKEKFQNVYEDPRKTEVRSATCAVSTSSTNHVTGIQNHGYDVTSDKTKGDN